MALLEKPRITGRCPRCGSTDVKVEYRTIDSSKATLIRKKWIKCKKCGYEG